MTGSRTGPGIAVMVTATGSPVNNPPPAGWYTDPVGRHHLRYWDGVQWTEHVVTNHVQGLDRLSPSAAPTTEVVGRVTDVAEAPARIATSTSHPVAAEAETAKPPVKRKVKRQVRKAKAEKPAWTGGGTMLTEPVLVINQTPKLWEKEAEFSVYDGQGRQLGVVREYGYSRLNKWLNPLYDDHSRGRKLRVLDIGGQEIFHLTQPKHFVRTTMIVARSDGSEVGKIVQKGIVDSFRGRDFELQVNGQVVGYIDRTDIDKGFRITDTSKHAVATVTREWGGMTKASMTKADNYVLRIHQPLERPFVDLVVTAALAVDFSWHQREPSREQAKSERWRRRGW